MDLWSKGLGKLVLTMRLQERSDMSPEDGELVMRGTMGNPTYWDWAVNLTEDDVLDFLQFLRKPAPVQFMVRSGARWRMLASALAGAGFFLVRTLGLLLTGGPRLDGEAAGLTEQLASGPDQAALTEDTGPRAQSERTAAS